MSKGGIHIQYIDLTLCELYYEVFRYEQVKYRNILYVRFLAVDV